MPTTKVNLTPRATLLKLLKPNLPNPRKWTVLDHDDNLTTLEKPTLILSLQRLRRHPAAPLGAMLAEFTLRLAVPSEDFRKREDQLDEAITELLFAIEQAGPSVGWDEAQKVLHRDLYLAFDVTLTVTLSRDDAPAPSINTLRKG